MKNTYTYTMDGTAANGQTWFTKGEVSCMPGDFPLLLNEALQDSFMKLTGGKAEYGHPGKGCNGPYQIRRFTLIKKEEEA